MEEHQAKFIDPGLNSDSWSLHPLRADDVQEIYRTGHMLDDAKATLSRDVRLSVGGVSIEGKRNEVINVPLWAGEMLESGGVASLEVPDAVTELKQALIKEQVVGEYQLATLDPRFYIRLKRQMTGLSARDRDGVEGIMMELWRMRRGKIVRLADSSRLTGEIKSKISVEERTFFEAINLECRLFEERMR